MTLYLCAAIYQLIYSVVLKFGLTPEDASDVSQTVCVTLLKELVTLRDHTKLSQWLITLTKRKCYKLKMLRNHDPTSLEQIRKTGIDIPDPKARLEEKVLMLEQLDSLRQAVDTLGEKGRRLIENLYDKESPLSHKQVADVLAVSKASIGRMRERCLKKLKTILTEQGFK